MSDGLAKCREVVERIKDILLNEQSKEVSDSQVADTLKIACSTLKVAIARNKLPIKQIVIFCYERNLKVNDLILKKKV